jgi:hypothetical protein
MRNKILNTHHDNKYAGHMGWKQTYEIISRYYHWPKLSAHIQKYCTSCDKCQKNKSVNAKPNGRLMSLPIPDNKWEIITMDFIVQLPTSNGFDAITVFVDKLTKMTHLIPSKTTDTSIQIQHDLENTIFKLHGAPNIIISDRDPKLTSQHWKNFMRTNDIDHRLSTSYHPQTDGQTERMNRTLEQILRMYINHQQTNWSHLLHNVEFAINNAQSSTTKHTPFFLNYGTHPKTPGMNNLKTPQLTPDQTQTTTELVKTLIHNAQKSQEHYYNQRHTATEFAEGDLVLIKTQHLTIPYNSERKSRKLLQKFIGPYKIIKKINSNAYKLELPPHLHLIHPVFSVAFLRKYNQNTNSDISDEVSQPNYMDANAQRLIERIHNSKITRNHTFYLIQWEGLPVEESTWYKESEVLQMENGKFQIDEYLYWKNRSFHTRPDGIVRKHIVTFRRPMNDVDSEN